MHHWRLEQFTMLELLPSGAADGEAHDREQPGQHAT